MKKHLLTLIVTSITLSACSNFAPLLYRVDVPQGNLYEQSTVEQIRPGMTRTQVRRLLGTPLLADPFRQDQDRYLYHYKSGNRGSIYRKELIIHYDQANRVVNINQSSNLKEK